VGKKKQATTGAVIDRSAATGGTRKGLRFFIVKEEKKRVKIKNRKLNRTGGGGGQK